MRLKQCPEVSQSHQKGVITMCSTVAYANKSEGKSTACSNNESLDYLRKNEEISTKCIMATECQRKTPSVTTQPKEMATPKLTEGKSGPPNESQYFTPLEKKDFDIYKTSPEKGAAFIRQTCWPLRGINKKTLEEMHKKRKNAEKEAVNIKRPFKPFPSLITDGRDEKNAQLIKGLNSLKLEPPCKNAMYGREENALDNEKPFAGYDNSFFEDRISVSCVGTSWQRNFNRTRFPTGNCCSLETKIPPFSFKRQPTAKVAKNERKRVRLTTASQPAKTYRENRASIMRMAAIRKKIKSKANAI